MYSVLKRQLRHIQILMKTLRYVSGCHSRWAYFQHDRVLSYSFTMLVLVTRFVYHLTVCKYRLIILLFSLVIVFQCGLIMGMK